MRRRLILAAWAGAWAASAAAQGRPSDYAAWFQRHYPLPALSEADQELTEEARRVFAAVAAAADKRVGRLPRLLLVDTGREEAQALPDGTVVISLRLLRFCFRGAPADAAAGRARLAFVAGHELAHLALDHAWQAEAFLSLQRHDDPKLQAAARDWSLETPQDRIKKEYQADRSGFAFMMMAGFDPLAVIGGRTDFLREWSARLQPGPGAAAGTHPDFAKRSRGLRAHVALLRERLPFFHFGVRLVQAGRHDDATPAAAA